MFCRFGSPEIKHCWRQLDPQATWHWTIWKRTGIWFEFDLASISTKKPRWNAVLQRERRRKKKNAKNEKESANTNGLKWKHLLVQTKRITVFKTVGENGIIWWVGKIVKTQVINNEDRKFLGVENGPLIGGYPGECIKLWYMYVPHTFIVLHTVGSTKELTNPST